MWLLEFYDCTVRSGPSHLASEAPSDLSTKGGWAEGLCSPEDHRPFLRSMYDGSAVVNPSRLTEVLLTLVQNWWGCDTSWYGSAPLADYRGKLASSARVSPWTRMPHPQAPNGAPWPHLAHACLDNWSAMPPCQPIKLLFLTILANATHSKRFTSIFFLVLNLAIIWFIHGNSEKEAEFVHSELILLCF